MIRTCHPTYFGALGGITSLTLGALGLRDPHEAHSNDRSLFISQGDRRRVGVGPILQRTQEPPPVRPFWVELHRGR
jgi:hypothetical protein